MISQLKPGKILKENPRNSINQKEGSTFVNSGEMPILQVSADQAKKSKDSFYKYHCALTVKRITEY